MRIIAGRHRGRHFDVPRTFKARPTTDFAKENLFNVLRGYIYFEDEAPSALDLFAGTGSITLELLSRGCSSVTSVELDPQHVRLVHNFVETIGETDSSVIIRADVLRYLSRPCQQPFGFVFADPPYALRELPSLPELVLSGGWLASGALFVLEHGADHDFSHHPALIDHRQWGSVNFSIFRQG